MTRTVFRETFDTLSVFQVLPINTTVIKTQNILVFVETLTASSMHWPQSMDATFALQALFVAANFRAARFI